MIIKLGSEDYDVEFETDCLYRDGSRAIQAVDRVTGAPVCTVTVNLVEKPAPGCIWVKDYSENKGLAAQLVAADRIRPTGRTTNSGWVTISEYRTTGEWCDQ